MNQSRLGSAAGWATALGGIALLAACSSTPPAAAPVATAAPTPVAASPAAPTAAPAAQPQSTVTAVAIPAYLDPNNPLSKERSVFFDYDTDAVHAPYTAIVERHAKFLADHPTVAIKIEGNTDERGSTEYNLSLGQRRAQAVLKTLSLYGVNTSRMEAISWGEEKPRATGHDEAAYAENRRADLVYPNR